MISWTSLHDYLVSVFDVVVDDGPLLVLEVSFDTSGNVSFTGTGTVGADADSQDVLVSFHEGPSGGASQEGQPVGLGAWVRIDSGFGEVGDLSAAAIGIHFVGLDDNLGIGARTPR